MKELVVATRAIVVSFTKMVSFTLALLRPCPGDGSRGTLRCHACVGRIQRRQPGLQAHLAVSNSVALDLELEPHSEEVPNTVSYELVEIVVAAKEIVVATREIVVTPREIHGALAHRKVFACISCVSGSES